MQAKAASNIRNATTTAEKYVMVLTVGRHGDREATSDDATTSRAGFPRWKREVRQRVGNGVGTSSIAKLRRSCIRNCGRNQRLVSSFVLQSVVMLRLKNEPGVRQILVGRCRYRRSRIQLQYSGFGNFTGDEKNLPKCSNFRLFFHLISLCVQ